MTIVLGFNFNFSADMKGFIMHMRASRNKTNSGGHTPGLPERAQAKAAHPSGIFLNSQFKSQAWIQPPLDCCVLVQPNYTRIYTDIDL